MNDHTANDEVAAGNRAEHDAEQTEALAEQGADGSASPEPTPDPRGEDREMLRDLRLKRLQRAVEYTLLASMHLFFLLAFQHFYLWWMAALLAVSVFGMNFQLTQLRERRRTASTESRRRVTADAFESVLFLVLVALLSAGGLLAHSLEISDQEYLAYVAAVLGGLFMAGLVGEMYWQSRNFALLERAARRNYVANLKRTIILPYTISRQTSSRRH